MAFTSGIETSGDQHGSHTAQVEAFNLGNAALIETVAARARKAEEALEEVRDAEAARKALPLIPRIIRAALGR
jgi:hypothetical protein